MIKFVGSSVFDTEVNQLSKPLHELVINRINNIANDLTILTPTSLKFSFIPVHTQIGVVKLKEVQLNVILVIDTDPLFDIIYITLLRLVKDNDIMKVFYNEISQFYGELLIGYDTEEEWLN